MSRTSGTATAVSSASAASKRCRPWSAESAVMPVVRAIRLRSASPSAASMPPSAHSPQASEVAARPWARRCWARASRKALAAA